MQAWQINDLGWEMTISEAQKDGGKMLRAIKKSRQVYHLAVALFLLKMQEHLQLLNTEEEKQLNIRV